MRVHTLAHGVFRQLFYRLQLLWYLVIGQLVLQRSSHVHDTPSLASFPGLGVCWIEDDNCCYFLAPLF